MNTHVVFTHYLHNYLHSYLTSASAIPIYSPAQVYRLVTSTDITYHKNTKSTNFDPSNPKFIF